MRVKANILKLDWKFWTGFLVFFFLAAGLHLFLLSKGGFTIREAGAVFAWLFGGFILYALAQELSSTIGAMICLAYFYLLPLGIISENDAQVLSFYILWLNAASFGLNWLIKRHPNITWVAWGALFLGSFMIGFIFLRPVDRGNAEAWFRGLGQFFSSPNVFLRWLEKIHGNLDLLLVLISLSAIFLLPAGRRNFFLGLWLLYGILFVIFPAQSVENDGLYRLLMPVVAISLGILGDIFYLNISKRGKVWQVTLLVIFGLAVLISAGYVLRKLLIVVQINAILSPFVEYLA